MSDKIQELKIQELKNMFFYTFGIVPLQNYSIVGDGMTDNRLALQQAIYDALEVGARYIFVPKGNYYYSHSLNRASEVIFIGNNVDTTIQNVEIRQFPDLWNESQATSSSLVPIGGVVLYYGIGDIPSNYLECNGQTVNTADYDSLYRILNNVNENDTMPETFTIPTKTITGAKYIMRAR